MLIGKNAHLCFENSLYFAWYRHSDDDEPPDTFRFNLDSWSGVGGGRKRKYFWGSFQTWEFLGANIVVTKGCLQNRDGSCWPLSKRCWGAWKTWYEEALNTHRKVQPGNSVWQLTETGDQIYGCTGYGIWQRIENFYQAYGGLLNGMSLICWAPHVQVVRG